jgi:response regulator RpfG family c-di-GMP phosphodiesterase
MKPTMTTANPFATLSHPPRALVIGAGPDSLHLIEPMLGGLRCQVEFAKQGETPYIAVRSRMPDLIVMAFAADDDEACQVLSMLQLDEATRRVPVLACVEGEPCAIIPGEWPRTRRARVQSNSPAPYTAR